MNQLKNDAVDWVAAMRTEHGCTLDDVAEAVTWACQRLDDAERGDGKPLIRLVPSEREPSS